MVEAVAEGANRIAAAPPWRSRPYPDYRDSGVPWLGEIPAGWSVQPLKHLASFSTGWTPPTGREDLYGGQHLWANISDLGPKILAATEKTISDAAIREARLRIVEAGSLLFSFKLSIGTVSIAGVDMYTNEAIAAFSPSSLIDTNYLFWAAPILIPHNAQDNIYGAPLLSRERIANAKILRPNLTEQRAIATFLDRETAKIDALVARKERLIELLQEKRTALITRAVTRGLDPNVPMKDSGVERLRQLPSHWTGLPLKRWVATSITDGPHETPQFLDEGVQFISAEAVSNGRIDFGRRRGLISERLHEVYSRKCRPVRDDVLVCKSGATTGKLAMVEVDFDFSIWSPLALVRAEVRRVRPRFLALALEFAGTFDGRSSQSSAGAVVCADSTEYLHGESCTVVHRGAVDRRTGADTDVAASRNRCFR